MIEYTRRVNYYETDKMTFVHHSNYIRYMEEASLHFQDQIGFNYRQMEEAGIIRPVVNCECRYKESMYYDDQFVVKTYVAEYTAATFSFEYEIFRGDTLCAKGKTQHCFTKGGKPINMKKQMPDFLNKLEAHKRI